MKLTDEEVEKVLSAHCAGQLKKYGRVDWTSGWEEHSSGFVYTDFRNQPEQWGGCINQIRLQTNTMLWDDRDIQELADWFDSNYKPDWTPEQFIKALITAGYY